MNTSSKETYKRTEDLLNRYASFITSIRKDNNYLSFDKILSLKSVLSNINNILTLIATISFAKKISDILCLNDEDRNRILKDIDDKKANSNGFDVEIITEQYKIIAEVKCNRPINNKDKFGQQQKNGIWDDAIKLMKGGKDKINTDSFLKIIVIIDWDPSNFDTVIQSITKEVKCNSEDKKRIERINIIDKLKSISIDDILSISDKQYIYIIPISYNDLAKEFDLIIRETDLIV